ncbi:MAG: hypothetical protein LBB14_03510 [Puniceicoccales bacterium]|jgi:hypothetical protein|nr:hypothetical protein [Puniceicoccales bacterium]
MQSPRLSISESYFGASERAQLILKAQYDVTEMKVLTQTLCEKCIGTVDQGMFDPLLRGVAAVEILDKITCECSRGTKIKFILLCIITFGIYYLYTSRAFWQSFDRKEDPFHREASRLLETPSGVEEVHVLLLREAFPLAEELFALPETDLSPRDLKETIRTDPLAFIVCAFSAKVGKKVLPPEAPAPKDADEAMGQFFGALGIDAGARKPGSSSETHKRPFQFRPEVEQNFLAYEQKFLKLRSLLRQRSALAKAQENAKESERRAGNPVGFKHYLERKDEANPDDSNFVLKSVRDGISNNSIAKKEVGELIAAAEREFQITLRGSGAAAKNVSFLGSVEDSSNNTLDSTTFIIKFVEKILYQFLNGILLPIAEGDSEPDWDKLKVPYLIKFSNVDNFISQLLDRSFSSKSEYKPTIAFADWSMATKAGEQGVIDDIFAKANALGNAIVAECRKNFSAVKAWVEKERSVWKESPKVKKEFEKVEDAKRELQEKLEESRKIALGITPPGTGTSA